MIKIGLMNFENSSDSSDALFSLIEEIKLGYQPPEEVLKGGRKPDFFSPLFSAFGSCRGGDQDFFRL